MYNDNNNYRNIMKNEFKTIGIVVAIITIVVMAASCKKESFSMEQALEHIIGVERHITTSASLPQPADKAYLDEPDGRKVKWELTDALNINGTNVPLTSLNADAITAKFEGTTYAIPYSGNDIYWAVYPTAIAGAASGSTIPSNFTASTLTFNFPATQTYDASVNAIRGNTIMAGYASVPSGEDRIMFQMRNLGAVLKLHLTADASATNKRASRIEFSTTNGALAGNFTVDNSATPTITPAASATQTLTVNLTDGTNSYIDLTSGADVYVILPPFASKDLTMKVYNTDNYKSSKTVSSTTLARNNIYTNSVSDLCFCEGGDGLHYFSVSATKQVIFSPGNLQWSYTNGGSTPTTHSINGSGYNNGTWRFAPNQYDIIGAANVNAHGDTVMVGSNPINSISYDEGYQGWIDLFAWGGNGYLDSRPYYYSTHSYNSNKVYYCENNILGNYDWGAFNAIYNPKTHNYDPYGTWRVMDTNEWRYLLYTRGSREDTCRFSLVEIELPSNKIIFGMMIYPDSTSKAEITSILSDIQNNEINTPFKYHFNLTESQFRQFEALGCAFLPGAGKMRYSQYGQQFDYQSTNGHYWTNQAHPDYKYATGLYVIDGGYKPSLKPSGNYLQKWDFLSVRLVRDVR